MSSLKATESTFRGLLEAAPDAIVVVERGGGIVLVNAHAEELFGYGPGELNGISVDLLVPAARRDIRARLQQRADGDSQRSPALTAHRAVR